jgi:hypothetical protein
MAAKKKTRKTQTKADRTPDKKVMSRKKTVKKKLTKKAVPTKVAVKTKTLGKKTTVAKTAGALKKRVRRKRQSVDTEAFALEELGARSGAQSGDLQGLSNVEGADSESVAELLEEGNPFEADVVKGVEDAGGADEEEVRTHEVLEEDVPEDVDHAHRS